MTSRVAACAVAVAAALAIAGDIRPAAAGRTVQRVNAAAGVSADASAPPLTARQVVARIQAQVGVPRRPKTVDDFEAGDPETPVTGVAVTMMATLDVLRRAAADGKNLIVSHEGAFFSHPNITADLARENDPVYKVKADFIAAHRLVVWRFHDQWHDRRPDGVLTGMVRALGWEAYQRQDAPQVFTLPETTLGALASTIARRLDAPTVRMIGDPAMTVTKVGLQPGFLGFERNRRILQRDDVQVAVIGEGHEWEIGEYAADAVSAGLGKALIVISHIPSEQAGMDECARWLRTFLDLPVAFVSTQPGYVAVTPR